MQYVNDLLIYDLLLRRLKPYRVCKRGDDTSKKLRTVNEVMICNR